jgi:hypothetical protein
MIRCPATGKPISIGITTTKESFENSEYQNNSVGCPHCGQVHRWSKEDAYLAADAAHSAPR